jgi:hypothetical protein
MCKWDNERMYGSWCKRALSETTTFWSVHRNWTFAAGPISTLVYKGFSQGWKELVTDWRGTSAAACVGFAIAWVGSYFINLVRSPILIGRENKKERDLLCETHAKQLAEAKDAFDKKVKEERQAVKAFINDHLQVKCSLESRIKALEEDLVRERSNLEGCPRVLLRYRERTESGFFVTVSGADGVGVEMEAARSPHYRLTSVSIPHVTSAVPEYPLEFRADLISDDGGYIKSAEGQEAWTLFAKDKWFSEHPLDPSKSEDDMARKFVDAAIDQFLVFPLRITYRDLSGKCYVSVLDLEWTPLLSSVEIKPRTIERVLC